MATQHVSATAPVEGEPGVTPAAAPRAPSLVSGWWRRPQNTWIRKAMFQIHLWAGLILGLYIVVVCVSGSALVFRNDIYDLFDRWIGDGRATRETPGVHATYMALAWLGDLHGRLLLGTHGMVVNAIGGFLTAGVCITGLIIWWPGVARWGRALWIHRDVGWKRFNFDLHSAVGFWTFAILFVWGMTGGYFVFPEPFRAVINHFTPIDPPRLPLQPQPQVRAQYVPAKPPKPTATPAPPAPSAAVAAWPTPASILQGSPQAPSQVSSQAARVSSQTAGRAASTPASPQPAAKSPGSTQVIAGGVTVPVQSSPFPRRRRRPLTKGGKILQWFSYLHYGNFAGWGVKTIWTIFGLAPAILFATALVMWWNRVLSPLFKRRRREWQPEAAPATVASRLEWESD